MKRTPRPSNDFLLLPDNALPCVWMTAGLVAYKLCDREFDCENCPFDAALQGGTPETERPESSPAQRARWEFRSDRRYHRSHGWIQTVDGRRVRYGLDVFAGRLLDHVTSVVLPAAGTRLRRGRPTCWLMDEAELIPFRAPISGTVLRTNTKVQHNPSLITTSPYDDGWLLEVECDADSDLEHDLIAAEELRKQTTHQLKKLHLRGSRDLTKDAQIGPTLADGGEPIVGLRGILGAQRYHRMLLQVLG